MMKRKSKSLYLTVMIGLIIAVILSGCSGSKTTTSDSQASSKKQEAPGKPQYGGVLKISSPIEPANLGNPPEQVGSGFLHMMAPVLETLGKFNEKGEMQPLLAEKWETNPEEKTITYYLKKGIKFHDGTDFNAKAVKWNIELFQKAKRGEVDGIKSIDVVDDSTVRVNLTEWNSSLNNALCFWIQMISPTAYEKNGKDWASGHPVGTGAFAFDSWQRGVSIKYKKNENYWQKGLPYLDGVEYKIIPDAMTASAAFQKREVDASFYLPVDRVLELEKNDQYKVVTLTTGLGNRENGLIPNSGNPDSPWANPKVREALAHAIDAKTIVEKVLKGGYEVTDQWGPMTGSSYNKDVKKFDFNPEKAKKLLAEAGYPNGFKTKLLSWPGLEHESLPPVYQSYLKEVGIDAEVVNVDTARMYELIGTKWDGLMYFDVITSPDLPLYMERYLSKKAKLYVNIDHPENVEALIKKGKAATNPETKQQANLELQKAVFEENHMFFPLAITTMPIVMYLNIQDSGFNETYGNVYSPEKTWLSK
ncbi:ABC transporter substrate-binding protein [Bacillus salipaludis]|uniref:ABC transporter substrate-binding protein n=1 Tax=Bacillus salipaludis TaxID=2547811 RepID=A0AA90TRX2_9BACI|nr:ABC transporter substrate-binding protein [Bacillus salipaludis]MDQ6596685.1 ABC transporter substrate-binding protein [Bacillus salipaludis]